MFVRAFCYDNPLRQASCDEYGMEFQHREHEGNPVFDRYFYKFSMGKTCSVSSSSTVTQDATSKDNASATRAVEIFSGQPPKQKKAVVKFENQAYSEAKGKLGSLKNSKTCLERAQSQMLDMAACVQDQEKKEELGKLADAAGDVLSRFRTEIAKVSALKPKDECGDLPNVLSQPVAEAAAHIEGWSHKKQTIS